MPLASTDWERLQRVCASYRMNLGGVHRRNRMGERPGLGTGSAIEFQEHRTYQPGDDLRRLDWAAYARSGQMVIRLERQEVMPLLDVVVDLSRSMWDLTEKKTRLFEETLAAILLLARQSGLDVRCLLAGDEFHSTPMVSPMEMLDLCRKMAGEGRQLLTRHLDSIAASRRHHSSQVWISDLLFDHDPVAVSSRAASETSAWAILQVLDEQDVYPPVEPACQLEDCEDGERLDLNLDDITAQNYRTAFEAHRNLWRDRTQIRGGAFISMVTTESLEQAMLTQWIGSGLIEPG